MSVIPLFSDRNVAGVQLANAICYRLAELPFNYLEIAQPVIVYALPRGGLPVALPIARALHCPLDVIVSKKITPPNNPELAIGAVTADGFVLWSKYKPDNPVLQKQVWEQAQEKARQQINHLAIARPVVHPEGALVLIVDDGIATGMTMLAAIESVKLKKPLAVWVCVPVAPPEIVPLLQAACDELILLASPDPFFSVGRFYREFAQVETSEAIACLQAQYNWTNQ